MQSLDPSTVQRLRGLMHPERFQRMVDYYCLAADDYVTRARQALLQGDADRFVRALAALRGAAVSLGASEVVRSCDRLSLQARHGLPSPDALVPLTEATSRSVLATAQIGP